MLEVQYTDTMPDKAAAAMEAVIQKYPNGVDAVLSIADDMALAAARLSRIPATPITQIPFCAVLTATSLPLRLLWMAL